MATYFVIGASRGIGFELVRLALTGSNNSKVIAGVRNPSSVPALAELQKNNSRLTVVKIDLESDESVKEAAAQITKSHPEGIDYLIVNAGVHGGNELSSKNLNYVFNTNVTGSLRVITEFLPLVKKGNKKVVASLSSLVGSFALQENVLNLFHSAGIQDPVSYPYRVSKAALNLLILAFAKDHKKDGIVFVPVHPGVVETQMMDEAGLEKGAHTITAEESARKQLELYHRLTIEDSGKFFSYNGDVNPF